MHEAVLHEKQNAIEFYTWGDPQCCLPAGATRATLRGAHDDLKLGLGDVLVFVERLGPVSGVAADARLQQRHAVRLIKEPSPTSDFIDGPVDLVEIEWHPDDALPFPLCLHEFDGQLASYALGNVVLADHGLSVSDPAFQVPDSGNFRPALARANLTQSVAYDDLVARGQAADNQGNTQLHSAASALAVAAADALPAVRVEGEAITWVPVRNLIESDRFAAEFVAETDDAGQATLRFGDGVLGRRPRPNESYVASYRAGNGVSGNVGAESLTDVIPPIQGLAHARNPLPATTGTEPEQVSLVRQYAPAAFRVQERAVTPADYEEVCQRHPDVQRAAATRRWTGSWHTMFVTVDRQGGRTVDAAFKQDLIAFFDRYRLAGGDVEIEPPSPVPLEIELHICVAAGYVAPDVERQLYDVFSAGLTSATGTPGYFHPDRWTFGQPVYLSPVIAEAMRVPGVARVTPVTFQRWREEAAGELAAGVIAIGRLEIAQLDNDPSRPENGLLKFDLDGGA
jgi:hypothetical protein